MTDADVDLLLRRHASSWVDQAPPEPDLSELMAQTAAARAPRSHWRAPVAASIALIAALAGALMLLGAHHTTAPPTAQAGATVSGVLRLSGGPAPGTGTAVAGTVYAFRDSSGTGSPVATAVADASGRFEMRLPPGRYYLRGESPKLVLDPKPAVPPCRATQVVAVGAGTAAIRRQVECAMK